MTTLLQNVALLSRQVSKRESLDCGSVALATSNCIACIRHPSHAATTWIQMHSWPLLMHNPMSESRHRGKQKKRWTSFCCLKKKEPKKKKKPLVSCCPAPALPVCPPSVWSCLSLRITVYPVHQLAYDQRHLLHSSYVAGKKNNRHQKKREPFCCFKKKTGCTVFLRLTVSLLCLAPD